VVSPRQNRVTPFGEIIATPERGMFMGNRGCLHNDHGQIVRRQTTDRWIICVTAFKGRKRQLMRPGHYTELFFFDEATALAAGHRPCAECQRDRYRKFLDLAGHTRADELDHALAADRTAMWPQISGDLPDGSMVTDGPNALLKWQGGWHLWSPSGYQPVPAPTPSSTVLTPALTLSVLRRGYRPVVALSS
jgi:hypothetical protein